MIYECIVCGKIFVKNKNSKTCSKECSKKNTDFHNLSMNKKKKKKEPDKVDALSKVAREAKEHGMTYGEYVVNVLGK